jgi:hypothetical protein
MTDETGATHGYNHDTRSNETQSAQSLHFNLLRFFAFCVTVASRSKESYRKESGPDKCSSLYTRALNFLMLHLVQLVTLVLATVSIK